MKNEVEKLPMLSGRLEALGDGIFAVAATLLILDIHLPEGGLFQGQEAFWEFVHDVAPNVICYFIAFIVLGIMWFGHRAMFEYIERTNRYFTYLGFLFYAMICFIPFSTKMMAADHTAWYSTLVYGVNLSLCNIFLYVQWSYGISKKAFLKREVSNEIKHEARLLFLLSPVVYAIAIVASIWYPNFSLVIFIVTPILYLIPNRLDKFMA